MALDCGGSTSSDRCQELNEKFSSFFFAPKIRNEIGSYAGGAPPVACGGEKENGCPIFDRR